MTRRSISLLFIISTLILGACTQETEALFGSSPSSRLQEAKQELGKRLSSNQYGWRATYFSRIDSLLYTDTRGSIARTSSELEGSLGYGGHSFLIRFDKDGKLEMRGDGSVTETQTPLPSSYQISLGSSLQLSFTTYNYLHKLINEHFLGSSDFLYIGADWRGGLRFSSPQYGEVARDYLLLEPLKDDNAWQTGLEQALANRLFFEAMRNPQIRIHRGDRDFFRSDIPSKVRISTNKAYIDELESKRYMLFRMILRPNPDPSGLPLQIAGIGSGYVGTKEGLSFRPGFRLDGKHFFIDFERRGDRFIAELVSVYDPESRITHIESKHLYPEGIPTGLIAEIWDDQTNNSSNP